MKFTAASVASALLLSSSITNALIPAHLDYLTDEEIEQGMKVAEEGFLVRRARSLQDGDEVSSETKELFESVGGDDGEGESSDETELVFDPPIKFTQYSSDTCEPDSMLYTGAVLGIEVLEEGVFCITDSVDLGGGETQIMYTKLVNDECSVFGVTDYFVSCTDSSCEDCAEDDSEGEIYLGLTEWNQVFPLEFEDHCFQQTFATENNAGNLTFDEPINVDYQFDTASTEAGLEYKKFIAVNSCIKDFVSSDDVEFTADSITVTDEDGDSVTLTEDSITLSDAEGSSITIEDSEDGTTDVTLTDAAGGSQTVEDANVTLTDDGGLIVYNDDVYIQSDAEGSFVSITEDGMTVGNEYAYIFLSTEGNFAQMGSTTGLGSFNVTDPVYEVTFEGIVFNITYDDSVGSILFGDGFVVTYLDGFETANITNVEYNFTDNLNDYLVPGGADYNPDLEGMLFFTIVGELEGLCDDFLLALNADAAVTASPSTDCNFVSFATDDVIVVATDDVVAVATDDFMAVGNDEVGIVYTDDFTSVVDPEGNCLTLGDWCASGGIEGIDEDTYEIFCGLYEAADLPDGAYTLFVPTDAAFTALFDMLDANDVELDDSTIAEIVGFHIHEGMVMAKDLECGGLLEMVSSGSSRTQCGNMDDGSGMIYLIQKGGGNRKNDLMPYVLYPNIMLCESVVHVMSEVLLPNFIPDLDGR